MVVHTVLGVFLCMCLGVSGGKFVIRFPTMACEPASGEECVQIRKCPYFNDLLTSNSISRSRTVTNIIRAHQCNFQESGPYVCCNRTTAAPLPIDQTTTKTKKETSSKSFLFTKSLATHKNYQLLPINACGPIMAGDRITNGKATDIMEFPWMALIAYEMDGGGQGVIFKCAGTLISERFILTAAHCTSSSTMVGVRLGEYDMDTKRDCNPDATFCAPPPQDFFIEYFLIHHDYDQDSLLNDIALIKLDGPANFSYENVQPICLPLADLDLSGKFAVVSGWGVTEKGLRSPILQKTSVSVVNISVCRGIYKKFSAVTDKQICAGGHAGRDSCAGDSGGPLQYVGVVEGIPRYIQYGIISYGPKQCGRDGKPGVYTKVFSFMEWILDRIEA